MQLDCTRLLTSVSNYATTTAIRNSLSGSDAGAFSQWAVANRELHQFTSAVRVELLHDFKELVSQRGEENVAIITSGTSGPYHISSGDIVIWRSRDGGVE